MDNNQASSSGSQSTTNEMTKATTTIEFDLENYAFGFSEENRSTINNLINQIEYILSEQKKAQFKDPLLKNTYASLC